MSFSKPKCNCPDSAYKHGAIPGSNSLSNQINSDWSQGYNGIKSVGGYCIHELATLSVRKELELAFPNGLPSDMPVPGLPVYTRKEHLYSLQNPDRLGDNFNS